MSKIEALTHYYGTYINIVKYNANDNNIVIDCWIYQFDGFVGLYFLYCMSKACLTYMYI